VFRKTVEVPLGSMTLVPAYHGGAHTADNIVVWIPAEKVLFGGCAVRSARSTKMGNVREAVLEEWPGTIDAIEEAYGYARVIVPGHGAPGGRELLENTRKLLREHHGE
jgi:glyoxylase-like metal-dependent hydrolase (beta-lactamase superfamily II)